MRAVTVAEMRDLETAAARDGWPEERLLEEAGSRLGRALAAHFPQPGTVVGYLGKGHNAGDTLVAMRVLAREFGWRALLRPGVPADGCAPLTRSVWATVEFPVLAEMPDWRALPRPLVLLDGLLGIGATGAPRPPLAALADEMAWLRQHAGAVVAAVDQPSGVDPDIGQVFPGAVTADVTFMIGAPKAGLLAAAAANAVGALAVVPVAPLAPPPDGPLAMITPESLHPVALPRPFDFHKGMAGRVAVVAGSAAYPGAAVLAAMGALRAGAGYVTVFTPAAAVAAVMARCPPEVIVRACDDARELCGHAADAWVIGPGLHQPPAMAGLEVLLASGPQPAVIDADALNFLTARHQTSLLRASQVVTPHPGEFARLAPDLAGLAPADAARRFAARHPCVLLLKGCRSLVAAEGHPLWCNPTGHPGMATGGQGDVLSGVIGARLAIGDEPVVAAAIGAWLCGRAAELAVADLGAGEACTPTAGLARLGLAFRDWCGRRR